MSLTRPLHEHESLVTDDDLTGVTWIVEPEHAGHTMTVIGRVDESSIMLAACSCGQEFRMAEVTVRKHGAAGSTNARHV